MGPTDRPRDLKVTVLRDSVDLAVMVGVTTTRGRGRDNRPRTLELSLDIAHGAAPTRASSTLQPVRRTRPVSAS